MARFKKDDITARANELRNAEGKTNPTNVLRSYEQARQEMADSLPKGEVEYYKELAEAESQVLKAPPTPGLIFTYV